MLLAAAGPCVLVASLAAHHRPLLAAASDKGTTATADGMPSKTTMPDALPCHHTGMSLA